MTEKRQSEDGKNRKGKGAEKKRVHGKVKKQLLGTEEGLPLFRKMLKEAGFDPKEPDLQTAWEVFQKFSGSRFDCSDDSLLFEAGIFDFTGEDEQFCLSFVRQFTIEVEEEYDYMQQLHIDLFYQPDESLERLEDTIWTYDFDDDFPSFFKAVEQSEAFKRLMAERRPSSCEIYQDEV